MRKLGLMVLIPSIGVAALMLGTALASPGLGLGRTDLGFARLDPIHIHTPDLKLHLKNPTDMYMRKTTIEVGGYSGWHTHAGPTLVTVGQGQVEIMDEDCSTHVFGPGQGFIEPPGDSHNTTNIGNDQLILYVTFLGVPAGGPTSDVSIPAPACAGN